MGGGIGGLSLATALHRRGFEAELVERSAAWPAVGAGIALHANGVRVLRGLGLGEAIDQASAVLPRWSFHDQQGALLCETDLEGLWGEVGPCLGIARIRLQEILLGGAAAVPHRLGVAVTALTPIPTGSWWASATAPPPTLTWWWGRTASPRPSAGWR